jgi:hypothetical protein
MTTSADEGEDARWNGIPAAMISWFHDVGRCSKGDRVSVLNVAALKYRRVLLGGP